MGASELIKQALKQNKMTQDAFAKLIDKDSQQVRNLLYRDTLRFSTAEQWLDALGYEIVIKKRKKKA